MSGGLYTVVALALAAYLIHCLIWPYKNCTRCAGTGRHRAPVLSGWRHCPTCKATGYRRRLGGRLWPHRRNR
jgi:hypothetical protein